MQWYLEHTSASYLANIYHHLSHFRLRVKPACPRSVDISTRSPFASPFRDTTDPHKNVDLGVTSDIPLPSSPASASDYAIPLIIQSSLASPGFRIDQGTAAPLPLPTTSTTAVLPALPPVTSVSRPTTGTSNDGTVDDPPGPDLRYHVDALEQSQESAMSVPEVATDVLRHPLDAASVYRDHTE
jgi:hypothetical protein